MSNGSEPSLDLFWETMTGFQRSAALRSAVDLDIFTTIDNGNSTAATIAGTVGAAERGIRILCDSMTVMGFLTKEGNDYSLTTDSKAFLSRNSHSFVASALEFLMAPAQRRGFDQLTSAIKNGGSQVEGDASMDPNSPMWVTFARAMMPLMFPASQMIAGQVGFDQSKPIKVLDIAAGHGMFGISVAQQFPNAEIYALDWPNVLSVATENAARFGVADRHHTLPGSAFETEFGDGYDVVLLTNFLHHFDTQTCTGLLKKINSALADDGKVMTLEFIPNDDRVSPPSEAMFSLVMLAATPSGDAYTLKELRAMFENAGFSRTEHVPLAPMPQHLLISER